MAGINQMHGDVNHILGITPWHCVICNANFSQKSSLQRHNKDVHVEQAEIYHCPEDNCQYSSKRRSDLLRHHRAHMKQAYINRSQSLGKAISSYHNKVSMTLNNRVKVSHPSSSAIGNPQQQEISTPQNTLGTVNFDVGPYNTV